MRNPDHLQAKLLYGRRDEKKLLKELEETTDKRLGELELGEVSGENDYHRKDCLKTLKEIFRFT